DHARIDAVQLAHARDELVAVGGVAHRAGQHADRRLGAVLLDRLAVVRQRALDTRDRLVGQAAGRVDAVGQPRDARAALDLRRGAALDVGDQETRGVRADVHDRDAHQPTGWGSGSPARPASRLSTATAVIRSRAARVAEPMCGTTSTCGAFRIGSPGGGGSGSVTSSAAVTCVAARSAAWSTRPPRAVLTRI